MDVNARNRANGIAPLDLELSPMTFNRISIEALSLHGPSPMTVLDGLLMDGARFDTAGGNASVA